MFDLSHLRYTVIIKSCGSLFTSFAISLLTCFFSFFYYHHADDSFSDFLSSCHITDQDSHSVINTFVYCGESFRTACRSGV